MSTGQTNSGNGTPAANRIALRDGFHTWRFNAQWDGLLVFADVGGKLHVWTTDHAEQYRRSVLAEAKACLAKRRAAQR